MPAKDKDKGTARKAFPGKNAKTEPSGPPEEPMALQKDLVLLRPVRRKSS